MNTIGSADRGHSGLLLLSPLTVCIYDGLMAGPLLPRLAALYETRGITIVAGLNPAQFDGYEPAAFTWFLKDGESLTNGLGIAPQEIYFLECLFARYRPRSIFAIGNSLGWSTLALGLANPEGQVLAIDAASDRFSGAGIDFTNRVAAEEKLPVRVVAGRSPDDVERVLREAAMPPVEFAFIDGYHTAAQVELDFRTVGAVAAPDCVYLFHDVATFQLSAGIERVVAERGFEWRLLPATTSGMAIAYDPEHSPRALDDILVFAPSPESIAIIGKAAWASRHRHLARWRRSLQKRIGMTARRGG